MRKLYPATLALLVSLLLAFCPTLSNAQTLDNGTPKSGPTPNIPSGNSAASVNSHRFPGLVQSLNANEKIPLANVPLSAAPSVHKAPLMATADGTEIWGLLISSDEWNDLSDVERPYGVYSFNTSDLTSKNLLSQVGLANGGGSFSNNTLRYTGYALERSIVAYYYEYDLNTWEVIDQPRKMDGHMITVCSAFDPTTYRTYAVYYGDDFSDDTFNFGIIDYDHEKTTRLSQITNICVAMVCDNDGNLYGITLDGNLNRINKETGAFTVVGPTGVAVRGIMQSAVYDRQNDRMYWAAMTAAGTATLYEVNLETGEATKVGDLPNHEEPVAMFIPLKYANGLPAEPTNLSLTVRNANTSGAIRFNAPSTTVDGKKLSGDLTYTVKANGQVVATGDAEVGEEEVTAPVRNLAEGYNTFEVTCSNSAGEGKSAYLKRWIGRDIPQAPRNVTFTVDTAKNNLTTLTWDAPLVNGIHGGYADPSDFTYKIVRYPEGITVSEGKSSRTFSENIPKGRWATHYYTVSAVNGEQEGSATTSNMLAFGDALDLPYSNLIDSQDDYAEFDTYNSDDTNTWNFIMSSTGSACAYCNTWGDNDADSWLVTPPVNLKAGYQYEVDFQAFANYNEDEDMEIYLVQGSDPTTFKQNQIEKPYTYNGSWTNRTTRNVRFDAPATGAYRIGFDCVSVAGSQYFYLDSIAIKEVLCYAAPDSVHNLKIVPSTDGTQQATISFNAPTNRNNGQPLDAIEKIEISRDGEVIKTFDNPALGAALTYTDEDAVNGTTTYTITAYNSYGAGLAASKTIYVGIDIPVAPTGVRLKDNFDGTATLSWNPVTQGINGMFIPKDGVTYNIYNIVNGSAVSYRNDVSSTSITIPNLPQTGSQSRIYYGVQSQTEAGSRGYTVSNQLLTGAAYNLPFNETFAGSRQTNTPWTVSYRGTGTLGLTSSPAQDQDNGAIVCYPNSPNFEGYLSSPKISLGSTGHPVGTFYYYCTPGANVGFNVEVIREGGDTVVVKQYNFSSEKGETGYRQGDFDLSPYVGDHYDQILFHFLFNETGTSILIDNITVKDMLPNDLSASLDIPVSLQTGDEGTATVTVKNEGENTASGYTVNLYQNGELVDTRDGEDLASGATQDYTLNFSASPVSTDAIKLQAVVDYEQDGNADNNTSIERTVFVYAPDYPTVNDLTATASGSGVELKWSPVTVDKKAVTDGFENYYPLETSRIGDWTTIDNDGGEPYTFGLNYIKQFREPFAYVVNNPEAIGYDITADPAWAAHNGEQYLVAFGVDPSTTSLGRNDDWLVSPLLSGDAQTVTFWLKSYNNQFGLEDYQILTSSTGKEISDFTLLSEGQAPLDWTEVSASVPAGTRYVALRHTSTDKAMFMVDDATYIPGGLTVKSYNIYRDGELIGTVGADAQSYTDTEKGGAHTYYVTVNYEIGESGASNAASVATGISSLNRDGVSVSASNGGLTISNGTGANIEVFTTGGARVMSSNHKGNSSVTIPAGVYLIKIGDATSKIVVK